jgi:hypothetical protein
MNQIKQATNVLALCTIVGLSCWIGYLLSANDSKARTIEWYEKEHIKDAEINSINLSNHEKDSITISQMPPVEYLDFLKRQAK